MAPDIFRTAVGRRLRLVARSSDMPCIFCGESLDTHNDHAVVCRCGGDTIHRHHAIRDSLTSFMRQAGLSPEKEKRGLLPENTEEDRGIEEPTRSARRPADIFLRKWKASGSNGVAFDVAATSFLRGPPGLVDPGADAVRTHLGQYADMKRQHLDTAAMCATQGFSFTPLVFDAYGGGWDDTVAELLSELTARSRARGGPEFGSSIQQRLSVTLQTCAAKAVLRRQVPGTDRFQ